MFKLSQSSKKRQEITFKHFGHLCFVRFKLERCEETQRAEMEGHNRWDTALKRTDVTGLSQTNFLCLIILLMLHTCGP